MSALEVIRRVEALGARLILDNGQLKIRGQAPLPDHIMAEVGQQKAAIMVALGAPLDTVVSQILQDIRPHLPKSLQQLPDDRLLTLVNWSIITAWGRAVRQLERQPRSER